MFFHVDYNCHNLQTRTCENYTRIKNNKRLLLKPFGYKVMKIYNVGRAVMINQSILKILLIIDYKSACDINYANYSKRHTFQACNSK